MPKKLFFTMYTFIDLFCGIGGFRLALEKKGMQCVFSSDIDKIAQQKYHLNFGETPSGDITKIHEKKIPKHDVLCAGFPCQSFSICGSRSGFSDNRGQLFFDIVRIAKYHKPAVLLLENVKNILSIDNGEVIKRIKNELSLIGYDVHIDLLNASHFGVPQSRERVYFVCLRRGSGLLYRSPLETREDIYLEDVLESSVDVSLFVDDDWCRVLNDDSVPYLLKSIRIGAIGNGGQAERIYSVKGHSVCLQANGGGRGAKTGLYFVGNGIRKLSLNEAKAVMGFPQNHKISNGGLGYKQLGNAVVPRMISIVFDSIRNKAPEKPKSIGDSTIH